LARFPRSRQFAELTGLAVLARADEAGLSEKVPCVPVQFRRSVGAFTWTRSRSHFIVGALSMAICQWDSKSTVWAAEVSFHLHVRMNCAVDHRSLPMRHAQSARSWAARSKVSCGTFSGSKVVKRYEPQKDYGHE
jgi:hypothetical protein